MTRRLASICPASSGTTVIRIVTFAPLSKEFRCSPRHTAFSKNGRQPGPRTRLIINGWTLRASSKAQADEIVARLDHRIDGLGGVVERLLSTVSDRSAVESSLKDAL